MPPGRRKKPALGPRRTTWGINHSPHNHFVDANKMGVCASAMRRTLLERGLRPESLET
jgi:hypothetical protein